MSVGPVLLTCRDLTDGGQAEVTVHVLPQTVGGRHDDAAALSPRGLHGTPQGEGHRPRGHPREEAGVLWGRQIGHQILYI